MVCSSGFLSVSHASQSDLVFLQLKLVPPSIQTRYRWITYGRSPIPLPFHRPSPNASRFVSTYTTLTRASFDFVPSLSNRVNAWFVCVRACSGFLNSMKTIMMLKICSVLPDMYIIIAFIGRDFAGAMATSQAFFSFSVSVSSVVGGLRTGCCFDVDFWCAWVSGRCCGERKVDGAYLGGRRVPGRVADVAEVDLGLRRRRDHVEVPFWKIFIFGLHFLSRHVVVFNEGIEG